MVCDFGAGFGVLVFYLVAGGDCRAPFDLLEAESEIIAGYNIEYSGMKFAMFFAGEFMHVFTNGVLMAVLFPELKLETERLFPWISTAPKIAGTREREQ